MVYLLCTNHNRKSYPSRGVIDTASNIWLSRPTGVTTLNHFTHFYTTAPQNYLFVTVARCAACQPKLPLPMRWIWICYEGNKLHSIYPTVGIVKHSKKYFPLRFRPAQQTANWSFSSHSLILIEW